MSAPILPIHDLRDPLRETLRAQPERPRLVLEAPTGSGKSTQVPQMLRDAGLVPPARQTVVLQPRRIAARMLARRVAEERGGRVGDEVGYQVRFDSQVSARTRIRYITEGILLRELLESPDLGDIGALVFDEFHERHFHGDIGLARALRVQREIRPDLVLVVMSATLDGERVAAFLGGAPRLSAVGRTFPVTVRHVPPRERVKGELWDHVARAYAEFRQAQPTSAAAGDCLVFLPGAYEIRKTVEALRREKTARDADILPLHGELSPRDQDAAVAPGRRPKIVVATNVAETSLTIDGVTLVIDSGLARMADFDARRGINTLTIQKISRASADQRAGRAGRTAPGTCLRLWSEADHAARPAQTVPEIHRMDLSEALLTLAASGVEDLDGFEWFERPEERGLVLARRLLEDLGALDRETGRLTDRGRRMARFPVTPRYARVLWEAGRQGCFEAMAEVVALTQGKPLWARRGKIPEAFVREDDVSDFQPLLRALARARECRFHPGACEDAGIHAGSAREIDRLAAQLLRFGPGADDDTPLTGALLAHCLLTGFPDQVARRLNRSNRACAVVGGRRGQVAEESVVTGDLFVATEITEVEGRDLNVLLNLNTAVGRDELERAFPEAISTGDAADWDARERRVVALAAVRYRDLVLESKPGTEPAPELAASLLAREVLAGNLVLNGWDAAAEQWVARLNTLAAWLPEHGFPTFGEAEKEAVLEQLFLGCTSYKQIKDLPVLGELRAFLPGHLAGLVDSWAPTRIDLPGGKKGRVRYDAAGGKPVLSAQLQHLYDVPGTPSLAGGRIPLRIEILAPNQRPVQITEDLAAFWTTSYLAVKKDLRGRYPKHEWR
jgi:ATP-dependent helicase HrpB